MKKTLSVVLVAVAFIVTAGTVSAAAYTPEQQSCLKSAQDKRMASFKLVQEKLASSTKDASKIMQDAMTSAQAIKDPKARMDAIRTAQETYNNNDAVKQAKIPWMAGMKAANDQYQSNSKACLSGGVLGFLGNMFNQFTAGLTSPLKVTPQKNNNTLPPAVKYTAEQQTCLKNAQNERMASTKPAMDALNAATKDASKARMDAMKSAQAIKDPKARMDAIKSAQDAYNKNDAVKKAMIPFTAGTKAANDKYQSALKACLKGAYSSNKSSGNGGSGFGGFFSGIVNFFSGKK